MIVIFLRILLMTYIWLFPIWILDVQGNPDDRYYEQGTRSYSNFPVKYINHANNTKIACAREAHKLTKSSDRYHGRILFIAEYAYVVTNSPDTDAT